MTEEKCVYNTKTGQTRQWLESYDQAGNVTHVSKRW